MPDGTNINENCGSTHPTSCAGWCPELGADVGLAFDGDADRLIAVDEHGSIVDGDKVMAICAIDMKERGVLNKDTVVATVMSNMGMEATLRENGISLVRTGVGDRYVLEEMLANGYNFGGEQSGHIIFLDHNTTGDGILSGVQLMSVMKRQDKTARAAGEAGQHLSAGACKRLCQRREKHDYDKDEEILAAIKKLEQDFHGEAGC